MWGEYLQYVVFNVSRIHHLVRLILFFFGGGGGTMHHSIDLFSTVVIEMQGYMAMLKLRGRT